MNVPLDPTELLRRLHAGQVEYIVIGGFAAIAHGVVRTTGDLDICPDSSLENLVRLVGFLVDVGAEQLGVGNFDPGEMPFDATNPEHLAQGGNFRLATRFGTLDMRWIPGIEEEQAYVALVADAVRTEVAGIPVAISSLVHLRQMKRVAGRPQDLQDLDDLAVARGPDAAPEP